VYEEGADGGASTAPPTWPSGVDRVVSGRGGLVSSTRALEPPFGHPRLKVYSALLGDVGRLLGTHGAYQEMRPSATGRSFDDRLARSIAVAEAIERYATCMYAGHEIVTASAAELGSAAIDLDAVPRSSARELENPRCRVPPPDRHAPMRWVESVELRSGRRVWAPAVMAFMRMHPLPGERFWLQISTGCAAHTDIRAALAAAICEVIERDAVALTWLQRLPLPPLDPDAVPPAAREIMAWCERNRVQTHLFDATSDLGVPTVYTVTVAPADPRIAQLVGCSTSPTIEDAVDKAVTESCVARIAVQGAGAPPDEIADFASVLDGAVYMARPERRHALDFLLEGVDARAKAIPRALAERPEDALDALRSTLERRGMNAYAVNLTTREAEAAGLSVVRVIIPALQPLTFRPLAQYRGHPRLFDAPAAMGHAVHAESDLNPWPQPFP
jgi:ribosomal protein S12 methylthiotransferase accessory factor